MGYEAINDKFIRDPAGVEICTKEAATRLNKVIENLRDQRQKTYSLARKWDEECNWASLNGCLTGDCPHDNIHECNEALGELLQNAERENKRLRNREGSEDRERLEEMVQAVAAGGSTTAWERTDVGGHHFLDLAQTMEYAQKLIDLIDEKCRGQKP